MNKLFTLIAFILVSTQLSFAQSDKANKETALEEAKLVAAATIMKDYGTVMDYTIPAVVELMGGRASAIELISSAMAGMETQGLVFEKAEILEVLEVKTEQDQLRCVIKGRNQMKMDNERIISESYLLGIFDETVNHWYFIEARQLKNTDLIQQVIPGFETTLNIPEDVQTTEIIKE
ncbi:MAG: hypothetical protein BM564_02360 [Bacteroidetes bacterium MedPE-SWsnd-G2]|nr:MAG: hypothetical protein BM564_02360 [Bacteroidetes bacterium MedPE-SWsnd-G2]